MTAHPPALRPRLRDLGISIGTLPTGALNAITDVGGVTVGHATLIADEPHCARTGVTIVSPSSSDDGVYAAYHSFNGNGELTGSHWLNEAGILDGPVGITNTHQVGLVRDTLVRHAVTTKPNSTWQLPVVAETYDGYLNDIDRFSLTATHVDEAIRNLAGGPVAEGNVGGGTGMICHEFKGGIGTSSRIATTLAGDYIVAALVQANYGGRDQLRLNGDPIGERITPDLVALPTDPTTADSGSIIVIIATDAPLVADQCRRLAQRATVGLARVGGIGANSSGDLFVAFSVANHLPARTTNPINVRTLHPDHLTPLFAATIEAVEESIWNALVAAETMTGHLGRTAHAIPHDLIA